MVYKEFRIIVRIDSEKQVVFDFDFYLEINCDIFFLVYCLDRQDGFLLRCFEKWVTLFATDRTLSVSEIIEDYGSRWKIETCSQRAESGYRQRKNSAQESVCRREPTGLLHDGYFSQLDPRQPAG